MYHDTLERTVKLDRNCRRQDKGMPRLLSFKESPSFEPNPSLLNGLTASEAYVYRNRAEKCLGLPYIITVFEKEALEEMPDNFLCNSNSGLSNHLGKE